MRNKMSDLRNHLFETIEMLKDEEKPMDIARARAISDVAQTLINTAKVEMEYAELMACDMSRQFIDGVLLDSGAPRKPFALPGEALKSA